ncbi:MAG: hypothetical protein HYY24_27610 [Verrucomicrobia bacterium]|nr:hypothetical protein [Verrucomicrobiota bacterium]
MRHWTTAEFWQHYRVLPAEVRRLARKNYRLLRENPQHPSLHFKPVGPNTWSARVGLKYRAVAARVESGFVWFWIGSHDEYERLIAG